VENWNLKVIPILEKSSLLKSKVRIKKLNKKNIAQRRGKLID